MKIRSKEDARAFRAKISDVAQALSDREALDNTELFAMWKSEKTYAQGERVAYRDKLYKCLQGHTALENWMPDTTPVLWVEVAKDNEYREIKANMLATEAFHEGECGWWQNKDSIYISTIAGNVWTPESYPAGWAKI